MIHCVLMGISGYYKRISKFLTVHIAALNQGQKAGIAGTNYIQEAGWDSIGYFYLGIKDLVLFLEQHDHFEDPALVFHDYNVGVGCDLLTDCDLFSRLTQSYTEVTGKWWTNTESKPFYTSTENSSFSNELEYRNDDWRRRWCDGDATKPKHKLTLGYPNQLIQQQEIDSSNICQQKIRNAILNLIPRHPVYNEWDQSSLPTLGRGPQVVQYKG